MVALKVFHPAYWDQESSKKRIMGEFKAISSLQHENIAKFIEAHWDLDPPAVALEYVDGYSLEELQPRLPFVLPELAAVIMIPVLRALHYAHESGVIHRDLKPANILAGHNGRVVVTDFGLAKIVDYSRMTMSGTLLGSPDYMSPEQAAGDTVTARSDVFSAGAVLYFLLTGTRPFGRHTPLATLSSVLKCEHEPVERRNPKISAELAALVARALDRSPGKRFDTAADFADALEQYLISVDLGADAFSLSHWLATPADSTAEALRRIENALVRRAEEALANGETAVTAALIRDLGARAPESAGYGRLKEVYGASQNKRRTVKNGALVLLSLLCIGGGLAAYQLWPEKQGEPAPVAALEAPIAPPHDVPEAISAVAKEKIPVVEKGLVVLDVPDMVRVFWDNKRIKNKGRYRKAVGRHRLRFEVDGREPEEHTVMVSTAEPTEIRVR